MYNAPNDQEIEQILNKHPVLRATPSLVRDRVARQACGNFLRESGITAKIITVELPSSRLSRWQLLQEMLEHFWQRWSAEYMQLLQTIPKWRYPPKSHLPGSLVLIKDECYLSSKGPLSRIVDVRPVQDGFVRVTTVKTATPTLK